MNKKFCMQIQEGYFDPFEGISVTVRLGLGQEKCKYIPCESHLVHKVELRKSPPMECYIVIKV